MTFQTGSKGFRRLGLAGGFFCRGGLEGRKAVACGSLSGFTIALAIHSFDPSLFTQLITHYSVA